ncbi:MAG: HAD family hydrolase [Bryobacteraceae bacterium]|nr:HAD family hydrolase [Bryobacteraceae bacterium]MDW8377947.1 HAD family hydrolase [Bryobacterales bacterium]
MRGKALRPALVLFDIDGTLLCRAGPHHRQALVEAVRAITGLETTTDGIPLQGMLDPDIFRAMLTRAGSSQRKIEGWMPLLVKRAQWLYSRMCPEDLRDRVCPGVVNLLQTLKQRQAGRALVTGNLSRIAWKKMERAHLRRYFQFGSFAEYGKTRGELVRKAIAQAKRLGLYRNHGLVTLIGDHANDVQAARENQIRVVAVATGVMPLDELARLRPDLALADLTALDVDFLFH